MIFNNVDEELDEEEINLDELFKDVPISKKNIYIDDKEKAVELIAKLIANETNKSIYAIRNIRNNIDKLYALFENVHLTKKLELYERFQDLCAKMSALQKIQKIEDKVVISFGGAFSAGKSKFINSISGIDDVLPVAQNPTTSIPTYIIKAKKDALRANSIYGYTTELSTEELAALTHEFYDEHKIGFSAFVDSIIVESSHFALPADIALLDTPGYTKYDDKSNSKLSIDDKQRAFEQIRASDYLIWLVDIDNGGLKSEDIAFIKDLRINTPILIVFTKADLKTEADIRSIVSEAEKTVKNSGFNYYGVTAYSSKENKEYGNDLIQQYFNYTINNKIRSYNILDEFKKIATEMNNEVQEAIKQSQYTSKALFDYISESNQFLNIRSMTALWGKTNQEGYRLSKLQKEYDNIVNKLTHDIANYVRRYD